MTINEVKLIELPRFNDPRGNLSFVQEFDQIPFKIQRVYWIYDVPGGENRGGHAFKKTEEFIVAMSGAFDVVVSDGKEKKVFSLNRSYYGLYIPKGLWRDIENFSTNSLALEFASKKYDKIEYVENFNDDIKVKKDGKI